ncbi:GNAT family N-acetyltransferase [Microbacterium sp. JZ31]|uniref:GNAT family N-acetyltransferase n=1 Tax=Microbacterium sp. JZ31 TaxID=1906274 RepID=UPI0019349F19|nr:GNAT family N-acetyltransferase [Microbacterium sp. JZ31]
MATNTYVTIAQALDDDDARRVDMLLRQLSSSAMFDRERVAAMITSPGVDLFVARESGRIVGMATLVTFPLVTGWRGLVEDVVVDRHMRGRGVARSLLESITAEATRRRLRTLDLTSRPSRTSALRLYEAVGFERRDTNVLRYTPTRG